MEQKHINKGDSDERFHRKAELNFIELFRRTGNLGEGNPGSGVALIEVTKPELDVLVANLELSVGTTYKVSGVDIPLYGGTTILIQATATNKLSLNGTGMFYNPKYDNTVSGFNVWDDGETYIATDLAHWGGRTWENQTGAVGTADDEFNLDVVNWTVLPYNAVDYNVAYDAIKYDYENDLIIERNEKNTNLVSFNQITLEHFQGTNPIKCFMWGNVPIDFYYDYHYYPGYYYLDLVNDIFGIANQRIINSLNHNINFKGYAQFSIEMTGLSSQVNCVFETGSYQQNVRFSNRAWQRECSFINGAVQVNLIIENDSYIQDLIFDKGKFDNMRVSDSSFVKNCSISGTTSNAGIYRCIISNNSYLENVTFINDSSLADVIIKNGSSISTLNFDAGTTYGLTAENASAITGITINNGNSSHKWHCSHGSTISNIDILGSQAYLTDISVDSAGNISSCTINTNTSLRKINIRQGSIQGIVLGGAADWRFITVDGMFLNFSGTKTSTIIHESYSKAVITAPYTVATLPDGVTIPRYNGTRGFVTDANAPTFGSTVAGGGAVYTPVYWNGANWIVG